MASVQPLLTRQQLDQVFKDPRTLLAFEAYLRQIAIVIPTDITGLQNLNFVLTQADATNAPNGHVITAGTNISVTTATGLVTIKAVPSGTNGQIQYNNAGVFGGGDLTGDISTSGSLVTTLATVNANVGSFGDGTHVATFTVNAKGLTTAAASVAIPNFTSTTNGFAPLSGGGTTNYLRADGTWAAPPGSGGTVTSVSSANSDLTVATGTTTPVLTINSAPKLTTARTIAMSGDVVWSTSFDGSGNVTAAGTIQANAVTTSKINNGAVTEAKITLANNTTNDVSTSAHGFAPILPNDATKYLDGTGAYSVPANGTYPGAATVATNDTVSTVGSYTDFSSHAGPSVTMTTGTSVVVFFTGLASKSGTGNTLTTGIKVSGATTIAAPAGSAIGAVAIIAASANLPVPAATVITGLTAGSNTFTMQGAIDGGAAISVSNRTMIVTRLN